MKIRNILISIGSGLVSILCILLKIQTDRLKKEKAKNNTLEKEKKAEGISRKKESEVQDRINKIKGKNEKDTHSDYINLF